jgi:hypothetical protein
MISEKTIKTAPIANIEDKIINNVIALLPTDLPVIFRYRKTRNQRRPSKKMSRRHTKICSLRLSGSKGINKKTHAAPMR